MKLKRMLFPFAVAGIFALSSCSFVLKPSSSSEVTATTKKQTTNTGDYTVPTPDNPNGYTITFVAGNGNTYTSKSTTSNKIAEPDDPSKYASEFTGWYTEKECKNLFNFNTTISKDTTLYAGWDIDYVTLYNGISTTMMESNMRIVCESYDVQGFGRKTNTSSSLGSGVLFYEDSTYYYLLTNNHVVYTTAQYQEITVEDCYENEYTGSLIGHLNTYDLALIRFRKEEQELSLVTFADYELENGDLVFSLGEPDGQSNSILGGTVSGLKAFTPDEDTIDMSDITFQVYTHSCPITNGSSGGMLIDSNLKLCGINFASSVSKSDGEFRYAYAIPVAKVREFISQYLTIEV